MVSLEKFYENVKVGFDKEEFKPKVRPLLDDVIMRLPDELQFQTEGEIFFASKSRVIENLQALEFPDHIISQWMGDNREGQCITEFGQNGEINSYYISIITNHFLLVSEEYIMGLIIHELAHMSYYWNLLVNEKPRFAKLGSKAKTILLHQIVGTNQEVESDEYYEKEKYVNAEAKRLGFEKEIDALES